MKGLKWRSYSPQTARIGELVGAQPVTIQAAEVAQALATGAMDSMISSGATGYDTKIFEHVKNFYDTQAWLPKNAIIVNKKAFDALDKATQDALLKAAAEAETRGWKVCRGEDRLVHRPAEEERHERCTAQPAAQDRSRQGRRRDAEGVARQGGQRRQGRHRRLPENVTRA